MISALAISLIFALLVACLLHFGHRFFAIEADPLVEKLDAALPQTQCGQCNHPGCRPYAEAMAKGEADINQCPPGGAQVIEALANLLGVKAKALNPENGAHKAPVVALIIEDICIGCTKCIAACPVDAIIGSSKQMHTVIEAECTGCELCIPPCPVDCIELVPQKQRQENWIQA